MSLNSDRCAPSDWGGRGPGIEGRVCLTVLMLRARCWEQVVLRGILSLAGPLLRCVFLITGLPVVLPFQSPILRQHCPGATSLCPLPRPSTCGVLGAGPSLAPHRTATQSARSWALGFLTPERGDSGLGGEAPPPFLSLSFLPTGIF